MKVIFIFLCLAVVSSLACGSNGEQTPNLQATIEAAVGTAVAAVPTPTPIVFPTPLEDGTSGSGAAVGEQIALLAGTHIPEGDPYDRYNSSPPTSGPHWATGWARCGIYDDEDQAPDERVVHNMEHGQVIISYNLTDDAEIERLKDIARDLPSRRNWMIMRSYSGITEGEVAITSWGWLDRFDGVQEDRIREFYDAHVNNGPESPYHVCEGVKGSGPGLASSSTSS